MKKIIFTLSILFIKSFALSQSVDDLSKKADSLYTLKSYSNAADIYHKMGDLAWLGTVKTSHYYNAACCFALDNAVDKSFDLLKLSIKNGYSNKQYISVDSDLVLLHQDKRWHEILSSIKAVKNTNNFSKAKLLQSDVKLFYKSFNLALKDTSNAATIFKNEYFLKGTVGLQDFFSTKIRDEKVFAKYVLKNKDFYSSIKSTLMNINSLEKEIYKNLGTFKKLYPEAVFPNIYFVIGRQTSNGTVSENGLLIGAEVMSKTSLNSSKWKKEDLDWVLNFSQIPVTISHEIIHFNQTGMEDDKTLLKHSLIEGSAEFLAELIANKTDGEYSKFKGREKVIWSDFKKEMNQNLYYEWLEDNEPRRPRNGMYWIGYIICKSYYKSATDKAKAIQEILNIKDSQDFFQKSKADEYIANNF